MSRKIGIICTVLGIFILLAGFSLRSFIYHTEFILKNDLNRRFVSFLYDNGLLDNNNISESDIGHPYFAKDVLFISNTKNKLRGVHLHPNNHLVERTSGITIELENNIFIEFFADEQYEQEIRDILAKFDPKNYPVNPEAIKLALLKNACANFGQILAFIEHHGFLGLPGLFIEGFNSAVRIPVVPLIYKSPAMQKFFQSLILPVIGFIMTAIGSFKLVKNHFS